MPDLALYKITLLNEFETREDEWTFGHFEQRLTQIRPATNYQDAKGIIIAAHQAGKWPNTVKRYLLTNFKAFGNVSSEFNDTFAQVVSGMSAHERAPWGLT